MKNETVTIAKDEYGKLLELARLVPVLIAENERLRAENKLLRDKVDRKRLNFDLLAAF